MPVINNCSSLIYLAAYGGSGHPRNTVGGIRFIHRVHSFFPEVFRARRFMRLRVKN